MANNFYNTISESGTELAASNATAKSQEDLVILIFKKAQERAEANGYPSRLTASDVWVKINRRHKTTLLTSVRRAISNLCHRDALERTDALRMGLYGKREHLYRLKQ